jgi:hypothetical protein
MFKPRLRLPSPALVISTVALSLVLGGTAFAAATATHTDKKADTKLIKKLAPSLSVKHAKTAATADSATNATNATHATNADHATTADSVAALTWTNLTLKNGWVGNCFGGGIPQVAKSSEGIVYFRGTMCTSGTNGNAFALPTGFVPTNAVWLTTDECNATTGRVDIGTGGEANIEGDPSTTYAGSAGCFTSLAGVEFAP